MSHHALCHPPELGKLCHCVMQHGADPQTNIASFTEPRRATRVAKVLIKNGMKENPARTERDYGWTWMPHFLLELQFL